MILGPRPTLGYVGYMMVVGSWYRMAVVLGVVVLATIALVQQGSQTLTLVHSKPLPFPPPMMYIPPPSHDHMTALDACSVEAATIRADQVEEASEDMDKYKPGSSKREPVGISGHVGRQVYVFLWGSSVRPGDVWAQWLSRLQRVNIGLLNVPKTVARTPLERLSDMIGWTSYPEWSVWAAARVAMLWEAGGVVLPLGVVPTRPLWVEAHGPRSGMLMLGRQDVLHRHSGTLDPVLMAIPAHHVLLEALAYYLVGDVNGGDIDPITSQRQLLTKAVQEVCGEDKLENLPQTDCHTFTVLPASGVLHMHLDQTPPEPAAAREALLLQYTDDPYHLDDPVKVFQLFQSYELYNYCPKTAEHLTNMYRNLL
ncbi:uncharacterized protein [Procambarus clarkii]|uniref:uncharacterized protein n=1 Tax=Procambarus clarkii TaxID=6728 RepID=UPI0037445A9B